MNDATIKCSIRWMVKSDYPEVFAIENASFDCPNSEDQILEFMRQRNAIGMVAEYGGRIAGMMLYSLERTRIIVEDFAVCPTWRNRSVGKQMIDKLKGKLDMSRRHTISVIIRETNLGGACFLRHQGFTAELAKGHFDGGRVDGYRFSHRLNLVAEYVKSCQEYAA
jgi:ribosomal protein S18 acetylase RimI-like enzyme